MSAPPTNWTAENPPPAATASETAEVPVGKEQGNVPSQAIPVKVDKAPEDSDTNPSVDVQAVGESGLVPTKGQAQVTAPPERIPIHLFDDESRLKKLSYVGPVILGGASIFLTAVVWVNTTTLTRKQLELQERQTQLQEEQLSAEQADMRTKFFNDLTSTDDDKKTFAAISLAGHGLKAWPVVHLALGVESGEVRESGVEVVHILFQSGSAGDRTSLLEHLKAELNYPNERLHLGVVQSYVEIEPLMNPTERLQTTQLLDEQILSSRCSKQVGRETVHEAVKFFGVADSNSVKYLLTISGSPRCGSGWKQAIQNLVEIAGNLPASERARLQKQFQARTAEVLMKLRQEIGDQELTDSSGFGMFGSESSVTFGRFEEKVKEEFKRVDVALSSVGGDRH